MKNKVKVYIVEQCEAWENNITIGFYSVCPLFSYTTGESEQKTFNIPSLDEGFGVLA